jgi:uncharacterized protein YndB with AHSA1/START domain
MTTSRFDLVETVHATIEIAASPERVFEALTDPEELATWFGPDGRYRTDEWDIDLRPGGTWSARTTDPDGREGEVHGTYVVVERPRRLELTWNVGGEERGETTVRFDLIPAQVGEVSGTRVTVTHRGAGAAARGASATAFATMHLVQCFVTLTALPSLAGARA